MAATYSDMAEQTQAGLNLIQQALTIYDRDLRLVVCNRPFQVMFDLPDNLVRPGAGFADTIRYLADRGDYGEVADVDTFVKERVDTALAFEPHYMERTRSNGTVISVEGSPLPQGGWVTVYTDITAIKRQEALLRARSEELSEQVLTHTEELTRTNRELAATVGALEEVRRQLTEMESRTRLTTEMMPAHIARLGPDFRYTYSNRRLGSVLPGRPGDIVGLHARDALGDEAFTRIEPYLRRACSGEPSVFEFTHDGSSRRIRVAFTPDIDAEGQVGGVYILSMDVTEEAQARAALAQTRKRELAAQLTSGLAHDFSNLLTIILGLQSRLSGLDLPDEADEMVAATTAAARRGGVLLDRIASISGRREMHPESTDITDLLAQIETLASPTLPRDVTLRVDSGFGDPILIDPGAVQDSLLNLVLNAADAIGEHPGTITLSARPIRDTWAEITVSDTGPGFTDEALERALDPFFTTKGGEGSGLGLSMVYDQAKLAGGQLHLRNRPEGGAQVTLRLPLRRADATIEPRLVLLVEDNAEIRENIREMLIGLGHQVIEAASAEEAEALSGIDGIGLILSDINLVGNMRGDMLLSRLKSAGIGAPAALMTSLPPDDPQRAEAAFPVIGKPFGPGDLAVFLATEVLS